MFQQELQDGEDVARCPSCSLIIRVIYDLASWYLFCLLQLLSLCSVVALEHNFVICTAVLFKLTVTEMAK